MARGKPKGDAFELRVCRFLSVWLQGSRYLDMPATALPFRRRPTFTTPIDGAWDYKGDIMHRPGVAFPFAVECKKYENGWSLDQLFDAPLAGCKTVWGFWRQANEQSVRTKLQTGENIWPLLFFTRNQAPLYVMMQENVATWLQLKPKRTHLRVTGVSEENLLLCVDADLRSVPYKRICQLAERLAS